MKDNIKKTLKKISAEYGGKIEFEYPLSECSTMKTGGTVFAVYMPENTEEIIEVSRFLDSVEMKTVVLGRGSNVLMPDGYLDKVFFILNRGDFRKIAFDGTKVVTGSGVWLEELIRRSSKHGFSGLEGLVGIPATVGGAVMMNAGYKDAISDNLIKINVLDSSYKRVEMEKKDIVFGYHCSSVDKDKIIVSAEFQLTECDEVDTRKKIEIYFSEKIKKQPLNKKTLGCIFKNPKEHRSSAGELIELAGMKNERRGDAVISDKHANFIVNVGSATSSDVLSLIDDVKVRVKKEFSVELEPEIEIL